jgi:hypothetical protein
MEKSINKCQQWATLNVWCEVRENTCEVAKKLEFFFKLEF